MPETPSRSLTTKTFTRRVYAGTTHGQEAAPGVCWARPPASWLHRPIFQLPTEKTLATRRDGRARGRISDIVGILDPEQAHARAIRAMVDVNGLQVVEIGCGEGRLTFHLAPAAARWLATDPNADSIGVALLALSDSLAATVSFAVAGGAEVDAPEYDFDLALFSWSL